MPSGRHAVGSISSPSDEQLGTVFAVTADRGLTAFHCVGDRATGSVIYPQIRAAFGQSIVIGAHVEDWDLDLDVAKIRFDTSIPRQFVPLPLVAHAARHTRFAIHGWPEGRPFADDPFAVSGYVVDPTISINGGVPAVELYCDQAAAGQPMLGFSGAPTIVATPRGEAALGLVRCMPVLPGRRVDLSSGGTVFATPVDSIIGRWQDLAQCVVNAVPADYGVSHCTCPHDVQWARWIASVLDRAEQPVFTRSWYLRAGDNYHDVLNAGFAQVRKVYIVMSYEYTIDKDAIHLVEQTIVSQHPSATPIPVRIEESVRLPEYLANAYPINLFDDLGDPTKCRDLILESLSPPGRPAEQMPFPSSSQAAMQERQTWLKRMQTAGRPEDLPGERYDQV